MDDRKMKQSKRVQIASESRVRVATKKLSDHLALVEIEDKLMTEEHIQMLQNAVKEVVEEPSTHVILDLSRIKRINSIGLGCLISIYTTVSNQKGILKVGGTNEFVKNVLNITKLNEVFEIYPTKEEAIDSFKA